MADHLFIGGDNIHIQFINIIEFFRLCICGTGHTGQFLIHPEEILKGDCGQGLVLSCDAHPFLGLHGLVQPVTPSPARHHPACKFIDNHDLPILDDVLDILFKEPIGLDKLLGRMEKLRRSHKTFFKSLEPFILLLICQFLIFPDLVTLLIDIGQGKIRLIPT